MKIVAGGGKKKSEILGGPAEGCPAEVSGGGLSTTHNNHNNHSTTTTTPPTTTTTTTTHHIKSTPHRTASPQHTKSMTTWIEATGLQHTRVDNKKCVFDFGQFRLRPISTSASWPKSKVELAEVEHPRQAHLHQGKQECSKPASNKVHILGPEAWQPEGIVRQFV